MTTSSIEQAVFKETSTPVVILVSHHQGSLGITRSLGRLGVKVYCIDSNPLSPGINSRYCQEKFVWNIGKAPAEATVKYLQYVAKKIGTRPILLFTTDAGAVLVADHIDVLKESYILPYVPPQIVRALVSKKEMYFVAKKYGVPTPEACFPQSRTDVEEYLEQVTFPVMMKGINGGALEKRAGKRMFITKSRKEVLELYDRYNDSFNPNFMIQEYIPGSDDSVWMFNGYFDENSNCLFGLTGKKLRQAPAYTGATSLGVCEKNDVVSETTKHFMKSIGYRGILDIGYRYDKRDGKYKVLDVNPRIGSTFRLFVGDNGMDVARAAYMDLTGQSVPSSRLMEGRKWLVDGADFVSSIKYFRDGNLKIGKWARSYRGVEETAWFAWDDPLAFFWMLAKLTKEAINYMNK